MIYDIFLYNGEQQVLEWRVRALEPYGVFHVPIESFQTFQGDSKPIHLIDSIVVDPPPDYCDCGCIAAMRWSDRATWVREAHQRNAALDFIQGLGPDDVVLLGDADEIPELSLLDRYQPPFRFLMEGRCFTLTWHGGYDIPGTVAVMANEVTRENNPAFLRHAPMRAYSGGWHLSWQGGADECHRKLNSFSHAELNTPENHAKIEEAIRTGVVPWTGVQLTSCEAPPWSFRV
jgi:beta-1,4-mannosyl-glycoprotein beta-1,4-N-acetylglucosaminyltransferase